MALQHKYVSNRVPPAEGFGTLLRRWRYLRELSTEQLALRAEIDRSMVSRLETGGRKPTRPVAIALADALDLTGSHRTLFLGTALILEQPLTEPQAIYLAGWRDGFTRR